MKNKNIQTKRDTGKKSGFRILNARTKPRKQRAAMVGSAEDIGADVPNQNIGRALIVILAVHVVAIAAVLIHKMKTDENPSELGSNASKVAVIAPLKDSKVETKNVVKTRPVLSSEGEVVARNSTPATTPAAAPVAPVVDNSHNIIGDYDNSSASTAPAPAPAVDPLRAASSNSTSGTLSLSLYTVKSGDSVWALTRRFGMTVEEFKQINNMTDTNIRVGEKVKVKR